MNADFINDFRKKIIRDKDNRKFRWDFQENYEWLDSYWDGKFRNFNAYFVKNMEVISGLLKKSKIRQKKLLSLDVWEIQRIVLINQKMIS